MYPVNIMNVLLDIINLIRCCKVNKLLPVRKPFVTIKGNYLNKSSSILFIVNQPSLKEFYIINYWVFMVDYQ